MPPRTCISSTGHLTHKKLNYYARLSLLVVIQLFCTALRLPDYIHVPANVSLPCVLSTSALRLPDFYFDVYIHVAVNIILPCLDSYRNTLFIRGWPVLYQVTLLEAHRRSAWSLYSAGMCQCVHCRGKYRPYSSNRHYTAHCHYCFPVCAKRFHRHDSGQPALLNQRYRGTSTVATQRY